LACDSLKEDVPRLEQATGVAHTERMNMQAYELFIIAAAIAVVTADGFLRLRIAPSRRDHLVDQLLSVFVAADDIAPTVKSIPELHPLANSLLKHFRQSFASRHIVRALAEAPRGITEEDLVQSFNELAARSGKRSLPSGALRKVIMILMGADFVKLSNGKFQMTELGWTLHSMLHSPAADQAAPERSFA
jgi:hypothetical protein